MIEHSESIKSISKALLDFQGAVDGVEKNKANPHFKSRYANLEAVRDTAVPDLQRVGIVYTQSPGAIVDGVMALTTMLIHAESGEWMKFTGDIALGKRDPQGVGSALTYMQRYSLMAALGLPPVDDDGEGAMERQPRQQRSADKPAARPQQRQNENVDYVSLIRASKDIDELKARFEIAYKSTGDSAKKKEFKEVYDSRKHSIISEPEGYVRPSFDSLPAEAQQMVKNMSAG